MKILLVGNFAQDRQESMQRFADLLLNGLRDRGHKIELIAPVPKLSRGVNYRYAGFPKYLGYVDKFVFFPRVLRKKIAAFQPDVVHVIDHANAVYAGAVAAPALVTCHDLLQIRAARGEFLQQRPGSFGRFYQRWILRQLGQAPFAACVSARTQEDLCRLSGMPLEKTAVIHNGLNFDYHPIEAGAARELLRSLSPAGAALAENPDFFLSVSGQQWYKNRPGLLRIYAALRVHFPTTRLVMTGKPLKPADEALARQLGLSDHIIPLPGVDNPGLRALYRLARGLVFPSWEEGFGWPLAEAQACGCPVFTSNRAPMTEVGGDAAVYFDPAGDPAQAADTIAAALANRDQLVAAGLDRAPLWQTDRMLTAYIELYRKLATPAETRAT